MSPPAGVGAEADEPGRSDRASHLATPNARVDTRSMRIGANSLRSRSIGCMAVLATSILLVGCNAEPAGTRIFGLNESDRDVIVASSQHHGAPRVLTAHTWGLLFDEPFELPSGEITVDDGECRRKLRCHECGRSIRSISDRMGTSSSLAGGRAPSLRGSTEHPPIPVETAHSGGRRLVRVRAPTVRVTAEIAQG